MPGCLTTHAQNFQTAGCSILMVFKLVMTASKTWRRLKGENRLPMVVAGVTVTDGVATATPDHRAA